LNGIILSPDQDLHRVITALQHEETLPLEEVSSCHSC